MAIVKRSVLIQLFPAFKGCCLHKCISTCQGESLHLQQQEKKPQYFTVKAAPNSVPESSFKAF